jgi:very-short-patch-repair endonuclease
MRRVARLASPRAANPFESVLRAIADDVPGLDVRAQVSIREPDIVARPDLVDVRLRIVLEADSFEWHGGRSQLSADARRYNLLVVNGWWVLRFSYEHVMLQPDYVRRVLVAMVALAEVLNDRRGSGASAA